MARTNRSFIFYNQHAREVKDSTHRIREVEFVFGTFCDWAACKHCFFPDHKRIRPLEESLGITKRLVMQGIRVIPATGEIMSCPEYLALYTAVGAKYLLTNGIKLASSEGYQLAQMISRAGIEQVGFTLSGEGDTLTGINNDIVMKAVRTVKRVGLIPTGTVIITSLNYDRVETLARTALRIGFRALKFNRLIPVKLEMVPLTPSPRQTKVFFDQLRVQKRKIPREEMELCASGLFGLKGRERQIPLGGHFCPAGRSMVAIDPDNKIYPCLLLMTPEYLIGEFDPRTSEIRLKDNEFTAGCYGKRECSAYEVFYLNRNNESSVRVNKTEHFAT